MANQPTKYRKFVVGAASAALVASAVAPVVSAATFSDTKGNTHEEAISALSDAGVISGYPDGTFQPNKTLTRSDVVKLMGKWLIAEGYEVPADYKTKPRFADHTSTSNDELLKMSALVYDNGLFVGKPDGTLDANGDITRENMAIVLVRAFDRVHDIDLASYVKDQKFNKDVTDLGKAKAEARPAIDVLDFFDITNPAAPQFNPKNTTTRGQFATFLFKTASADFSAVGGTTTAPNSVAKVTAVNNTTVEVTMKDDVDNVSSLNFTIDGLTVANAGIKQTDKKTVVLTTASQKAGEEYTVKLDNKEVGKFTGIEAVVPTSIELTAGNNQAKVGDQVILSAYVGQKTAGIPVTFNIDAPIGSLNKDSVVEVVTNADGIATYSYTQYSPDADSVTVYPTGAPQLRDFATVYWGKDTILAIEEAAETVGNVQPNGVKKTYTVTYKDPKTGQPLANRDLNVTFVENLNVPFNSISKATVTNPQTGVTKTPYQTSTGVFEAISVKTDSEGKATFIVSGTNTAITPAVFVDGSRAGYYNNTNGNIGNTGWGSGTDALDYKNGLWESTELTVSAPQVKFEGAQLQNQITVARDGEEEASATIFKADGTIEKLNGREYSIKVNDKDGKAYANGLVNVALEEVIDKDLTTNTTAKLANAKDSTALTLKAGHQQGLVKLDSKGEAKFVLYGKDDVTATPFIWIDQNKSENNQGGSNQTGVFENGEPFFKAPITNFQYERVIAGQLKLEGKLVDQNVKLMEEKPNEDQYNPANYNFSLLNQSGKELERLEGKMTYEIRNTSGQPLHVTLPNATYKTQDNNVVTANYRIEEYGSITVSADVTDKSQTELVIIPTDFNKPATVLVTPSFVTIDGFNASVDNDHELQKVDKRDFNKYVTTKGLTATFGYIPNNFTGEVVAVNKADDTVTLYFNNNTYKISYKEAVYYYKTSQVPATFEYFEDKLSVGDTVTFTKGDGETVKNQFDIINDVNETDERNLLSVAVANANVLVNGATVGTEEGQYPKAAVDALNDAIKKANSVVLDGSSTKADLAKAKEDLATAVAAFDAAKIPTTPVVDPIETALKALRGSVDAASKATEDAVVGTEPGQFAQADIDTLNDAIDAATVVFNDAEATVEELEEAKAELDAAIKAFNESAVPEADAVDTAALQTAVDAANEALEAAEVGTEEGNYPQEAVDAYEEAIAEAQAVLDNEDATQAEVDAAVEALAEATAAFEASVVLSEEDAAKADLQAAVDAAEAALENAVAGDEEGNYPQDAIDAYQEAVDAANEVLADEDATQEDYENALEALNDATVAFNDAKVPAPAAVDTAALEAAVDAATDAVEAAVAGTEEGNYPQDAIDAYAEAIADAQAVLDNEDATQAEVDAAVIALADATAAFEDAQVVVVGDIEITTATATGVNDFATFLGTIAYDIQGTVADDTVTEVTLTFTGADPTEVVTVPVVNGEFEFKTVITDFFGYFDNVEVSYEVAGEKTTVDAALTLVIPE